MSRDGEELQHLPRRIAIIGLIVLFALALGLSACGARTVATVNGESIKRDQFDTRLAAAKDQYASYGEEITEETLAAMKDDVLQQLIDELLLVQGAKSAGVEVTAEDVDEYYAEMVASYETEAAFLEALEENDYTEASLRQEISRFLLIVNFQDQYVLDHVDPASIAVTEDEVRALYATYSAQIEGDMPPYEDVAILLEQELRDQKITDSGVLDSLIEGLRAAAAITRSL